MKETYPNILQSFGLFGLFVLINLIVGLALGGLGGALLEKPVVLMIATILVNGVLILIALNFKETKWDFLFGGRHQAAYMIYFVCVLFNIFYILFMDPIVSAVPMPEFLKEMFEDIIQKDIWSYLTLAIVAPITEELIFRRLILTGLEKNYSTTKAILWSAFFFALFHLNPWQGISAFLIGIFLGWIYVKTRDIWLCIFIHFVNNSLSYVAFVYTEDAFFSIVDLTGYDYRLALIMGCSLICMYFCLRFLAKQFKLNYQ
jgi:hypothetical protein